MPSNQRFLRICVAVVMAICTLVCWCMVVVTVCDFIGQPDSEWGHRGKIIDGMYCFLFLVMSLMPAIFGGAALFAEDFFDGTHAE